jgi:glycerophosphoryl diester phosphodiesterase
MLTRRKVVMALLLLLVIWVGLHLALSRPARDPYRVAHRGAAGLAPENTLAAIRAGIESGAAYIEIDVQRSADGVLALHHDQQIDGPDGSRAVGELPYETIRAIGEGGEPIPTLEEALDLFASRAADHQTLILEGKSPASYPGIAGEIIAAVDARNLRGRVLIMSFDHDWLREVHRLAPDAALGSIHVYPFDVPEIDSLQVVGMHWSAALLDPTLIRRIHAKGLEVNVWTIDWPPFARLAYRLGADGVTMNDPTRFLSSR